MTAARGGASGDSPTPGIPRFPGHSDASGDADQPEPRNAAFSRPRPRPLLGEQRRTTRERQLQSEAERERAEELHVAAVMLRQRRLSLLAAGLLFGLVTATIILEDLFPGVMNRPFWHGFSPSFLFAAVLIYPITWVIALIYTLRANNIDEPRDL